MYAAAALVLLSLCADFSAADCGTFKYKSFLGTLRAMRHDTELSGVNLISQKQQMSRAVTCPASPKAPHEWSPNSGCPPSDCSVCSHGTAVATAMTNLTIHDSGAGDANQRIIDLALGQVKWATLDKNIGIYQVFETQISGRIGGACGCPAPGTSGAVFFRPYFACITGVLEDCDDSTELESDGRAVTVCMPYHTPSPDPAPDGDFLASTVTKEYAQKHRKNPALGNAGSSRASSWLRELSFGSAMLVAAFVYMV